MTIERPLHEIDWPGGAIDICVDIEGRLITVMESSRDLGIFARTIHAYGTARDVEQVVHDAKHGLEHIQSVLRTLRMVHEGHAPATTLQALEELRGTDTP